MEVEKLKALSRILRRDNPILNMTDWDMCAIAYAKVHLEVFLGLPANYLSTTVNEFLGLNEEQGYVFSAGSSYGYHNGTRVPGKAVADRIDQLIQTEEMV